MESRRDYLEENTIQLIRAGSGHQAQPEVGLRSEVLHRLRCETRMNRREVEFPNRVLVILTGVLALAALWLVIQAASGRSIITSAVLSIMAMVLILNLALVPVASLVIVIRRRHVNAS